MGRGQKGQQQPQIDALDKQQQTIRNTQIYQIPQMGLTVQQINAQCAILISLRFTAFI
jgi:hypothetical protein